MQKCKKKDGLIYDFEVAEIKKNEYRIYLNDDFVCAMTEDDFKENFDIIKEENESYSKEDYKKFLEIRDMMIEFRKQNKQNILIQIKDKEEEKERAQDLLAKSLKIPLARPIALYCEKEIKRLRFEIEALKCTLEGMEKNNEKM